MTVRTALSALIYFFTLEVTWGQVAEDDDNGEGGQRQIVNNLCESRRTDDCNQLGTKGKSPNNY